VAYKPAGQAEGAGSPAVGLAEFRRAAIELSVLDDKELDRFSVPSDDVSRLARALVRAGKLTPYQAAALAQGKAKGLVVGPYLILDKRGQGGMGVVFKARHRPTCQLVALKVLPPSFGRDRDAVLRFRREVEVAARLDHPNIVAALDASEDRGVHFLAMEFIEGQDLDALVTSGGPLPIELAIHCAIQAARGMEAAHAKGIVHRDIKPANLMLAKSGVVQVLDLGLARVIESTSPSGKSVVASLTQTGAYMGTVDFIAPEQADDAKSADHRADIYSLGCTLYFLLTGRPPFEGETLLKKLIAHQERPAPSLGAARPDAPKALEDAYQAMMAKRPADRPQSMTAVIGLLESCRSPIGDEEEARAGLTTYAAKVFKRAAPRGRDRGPEASIFARRNEAGGLQIDPDLRFEDLVMDLREEVRPEPLSEEKLPPKLPRMRRPRKRPERSPALLGLGAITVLGICALGYLLIIGNSPKPAASQGPTAPGSAPDVPSGTAHAGALAPSQPAGVGSTPFFDRSRFEVLAGQWRVEGNELVQTDLTRWYNSILFGDNQWTDYDFSVDAMRTGGENSFSLHFRAGDRGNSYKYVMGGDGNSTCSVVAHERGRTWSLKSAHLSLQDNTWYTARVHVRGNHIACFLCNSGSGKDTRLFDLYDDRFYSRGRVGLETFISSFRFRDIKVTSPDGKVLWEGLPAVGSKTTAGPPPSASREPNGWISLFNGKDLSNWAGAVDDYEVRDGLLSCKPGKRAMIYDPRRERRDFVARVEFRLAPGAESGLLIRYRGYGDFAYESMCEIQILDDSHPSYANIDARCLHGSAWGIAAAKRGHLKPLGESNVQEVTVRGSTVKVELNGVAILDTDLAPIRDFHQKGRPHPGKDRRSGYFGVQSGTGTNQGNVQYRKIAIKEIPDEAPSTNAGPVRYPPPADSRRPRNGDAVAFQPGSVWVTTGLNGKVYTFTLLERTGDEFEALYEGQEFSHEVKGTIREGEIRWLGQDTTVMRGNPGHNNFGVIKGHEISLTYSRKGLPGSGSYTLRLKNR